jgi:hypothetical protein
MPVGGDVPRLVVESLGAPEEPALRRDVADRRPRDAVQARRVYRFHRLRHPRDVGQRVDKQPYADQAELWVAVLPPRRLEFRDLLPVTRVLRAPEEEPAAPAAQVVRRRLVAEVVLASPVREVGVRVVGAIRHSLPRLQNNTTINGRLFAPNKQRREVANGLDRCESRAADGAANGSIHGAIIGLRPELCP